MLSELLSESQSPRVDIANRKKHFLPRRYNGVPVVEPSVPPDWSGGCTSLHQQAKQVDALLGVSWSIFYREGALSDGDGSTLALSWWLLGNVGTQLACFIAPRKDWKGKSKLVMLTQ